MIRLTTDDFIKKAIFVHGNQYTYDNVVYVNSSTHVNVTCKVHGDFPVRPYNHIHGRTGCPKCDKSHKQTRDEFIERAIKKHGSLYNYDKVVFTNMQNPVEIVCAIHGSFWQPPTKHLIHKCPRCSGKWQTLEDYSRRANIVHNYKYTYTSLSTSNGRSYIDIVCPYHGTFNQDVQAHLNGNGCPSCANVARWTRDRFLSTVKEIHGGLYTYPELPEKLRRRDKIAILCKKHGLFYQTLGKHVSGRGCSRCKASYAQKRMARFCRKHNIVYEEELWFPDCRDINPLPFDLAVYNYNKSKLLGLIEYDGEHHYHCIDRGGACNGKELLITMQKHDKIKDEYCATRGIRLLRIPYYDKYKLDEILAREVLTWVQE